MTSPKKKPLTKANKPAPSPKKQKAPDIELTLTKAELVHLRDLFNVVLMMTEQTVSQSLAEVHDNSKVEERLWGKLHALC